MHIGGFVRHSWRPMHRNLPQSLWSPFLFVQSQLEYKTPPFSSWLLTQFGRECPTGTFCTLRYKSPWLFEFLIFRPVLCISLRWSWVDTSEFAAALVISRPPIKKGTVSSRSAFMPSIAENKRPVASWYISIVLSCHVGYTPTVYNWIYFLGHWPSLCNLMTDGIENTFIYSSFIFVWVFIAVGTYLPNRSVAMHLSSALLWLNYSGFQAQYRNDIKYF
jgi:hypothetical protein